MVDLALLESLEREVLVLSGFVQIDYDLIISFAEEQGPHLSIRI